MVSSRAVEFPNNRNCDPGGPFRRQSRLAQSGSELVSFGPWQKTFEKRSLQQKTRERLKAQMFERHIPCTRFDTSAWNVPLG